MPTEETAVIRTGGYLHDDANGIVPSIVVRNSLDGSNPARLELGGHGSASQAQANVELHALYFDRAPEAAGVTAGGIDRRSHQAMRLVDWGQVQVRDGHSGHANLGALRRIEQLLRLCGGLLIHGVVAGVGGHDAEDDDDDDDCEEVHEKPPTAHFLRLGAGPNVPGPRDNHVLEPVLRRALARHGRRRLLTERKR